MECPNCDKNMKKVPVKIQDAKSLAISYQCANCGYFDFEENSMKQVVGEIKAKEAALKIRQKLIKLSQGRLGMYLSHDVVRSLELKPGKDIYISVPDKKHIVLELP